MPDGSISTNRTSWTHVGGEELPSASRTPFELAATGALMGVVHVLSGPDHLSALVALSAGRSWRAFTLGARWGCGHSLGLILMAVLFFTMDVDLKVLGPYCEVAVGVFMIALGLWSTRRALNLTGSGDVDREMRWNEEHGSTEMEMRRIEEHGLIDRSTENSIEHGEAPEPDTVERTTSSPHLQRLVAFGIGIVHGIAGPGGILGVLPAIELHDGVLAVAYLGSFCFFSITAMGLFAALYGEVTSRIVSRKETLLKWVTVASGMMSLVVGILWLVLLYFGVLDEVFP